MGLISWIKDKYYNHQLSKADNLATNGNIDEAKSVYTELLGKQDYAIVHLAKMVVDHADSVQQQINALKEIKSLTKYVTSENRTGYTSELDRHIFRMEKKADSLFSRSDFSSAVILQESILTERNNPTNKDRYHRFKAFMYYAESDKTRDYKNSLKAATEEFKKISSYSTDDLHRINKELVDKFKFVRAITFLLEFNSSESWVQEVIVKHIINVILNNDFDIKDIEKISNICPNKEICNNAATQIHSLAISYGNKRDYKKAVLLDNYAFEYLSENNSFIYERCKHILEELAPRANANEISGLMKSIKSSNLSETQRDSIQKRIAKIASLAEEAKAIKICRLFEKEVAFEKIYVDKALSLCKAGNSNSVNAGELRQKIKDITNDTNYPDTLGQFVRYISAFDLEFFRSSIDKIIQKNDMSLLDLYWGIKSNHIYFDRLISDENPHYSDVIAHIVSKHKIFLAAETYRNYFCQKVKSVVGINYVISVCEKLLQNKCNVNSFYETTILELIKNQKNTDAIAVINHSLSVIKTTILINEKKRLIRTFITEKQFDLAKNETQTLEKIDEECWTIYAEILYAKSVITEDTETIIDLFKSILDLGKTHTLYSSFQNTEKNVFTKISDLALQFFNSGDRTKANELCNSISHREEYWLPLFIQLCNLELQTIDTLSLKIKHIEDSLETINKTVDKNCTLDNHDYNSLWITLSNLYINKSESQPKEKAIESLSAIRTNIRIYCNAELVVQTEESLTKLIVKLKWNYALELEQEYAFSKAIQYYISASQENVASYQKRSLMRANICHLKESSVTTEVETSILQNLEEKSYVALREDIAYRYGCYLIKSIRPGEAETIIRKYLPQEKGLLEVCQNIYIKESELKLEEFNKKIELIQQNSMSIKAALAFLKEIDNYKEEISNHLTDTSAKFSKYKIQIKAYILKCMFNNESYVNALKALKSMHPNFIENETAFRNLAVASIGIIESECDDENMLRLAIAIALSAIYSDKLFVNSLEHTSWDDQFTFTLDSSLGKSVDDDYDALPDNVNFDEAIDNQNIGIKDVQNNLIIRIETAIRDKHAALEEFYRHEKDSIDKILDLNLDQSFIIASPTLCSKLESAKISIKEALDYEYNQEYGNQEDVLSVGVMYGFKGEVYSTYAKASQALNSCKEALSDIHDQATLQSTLSSNNLSILREFDGLYSQLKALCSSCMNEAIRSKLSYKEFLDIFEFVCRGIKDTSMSLSCANYINGEVIHRLNENKMKLREGIGYMVRIYNLAPSNVQVKQNLEGILHNLILECEKNGSSYDKSALSKAKRDLNGRFDSFIEDAEVQAALSVIVDQVNEEEMDRKTALQKVYALYVKKPNNPRICENLATLCTMCIHQYIIRREYGTSEVRTILNKLKANKSNAFEELSSKFESEYDEIMSHVPAESRVLLEPSFDIKPGISLNENGLALKEGLEYLSDLGGFKTGILRFVDRMKRRRVIEDDDLPF